MTKISKLDDLEIYKESLRLVKAIFDICKNPLLSKEYALLDQLKRAAISICANIAEGYGRRTRADFGQFLSIALGSTNEVGAILDIVKINFPGINATSLKEEFDVLGRRIYALRKSLLSAHNP